ncbi:SPOR domain-containing protein [Sodalis sp. RH24]|uniref:SPOR domain-containing protein n=2 Tax=Sodalis TaxID=84565 RepID=UPI0039B533FA
MDEFKSEDELRPDSSDRRPPRQRKGPSVPKVAMSKQHLMIGIGILVLLLLVIAIGSALKAPTQMDANQQNPNVAEKSIELPGTANTATNDLKPVPDSANPDVNSPGSTPAANGTVNGGNGNTAGTVNGSNGTAQQPQTLNAPPVAAAPTQAPPSADGNPQHRIDLPGNMADALSQQGDRVNGVTQQVNGDQPASTLPTAPATVAPAGREPAAKATKPASAAHKAPKTTAMVPSAKNSAPTHNAKAPAAVQRAPAVAAPQPTAAPTRHTMVIEPATRAPAAAAQRAPAATAAPVATSAPAAAAAPASAGGSIQAAPAGYYTVQISSASQATTLNAYAKKQQLGQYWVYETRRDGKPWYVLVSGVYPTSAQAKSAVAQLPADIQAKKPWAREIGQVKQDQNK